MVVKMLIFGTAMIFLVILGAIIFICVDDARSKKENKDGKK